nr:hypothetical protein QSJ49_07885 [Halobacterium salinarum]
MTANTLITLPVWRSVSRWIVGPMTARDSETETTQSASERGAVWVVTDRFGDGGRW